MTDFRQELCEGDPCLVVDSGKEFPGKTIRVSARFIYVRWGAGDNQFTQEGFLMTPEGAKRTVRLKLVEEKAS